MDDKSQIQRLKEKIRILGEEAGMIMSMMLSCELKNAWVNFDF